MSSKIILCDVCDGWGKIQKEELEDYHNNIYEYWDEKCDICDGYGRLIEEEDCTKIKKNQISSRTIIIRKLTEKEMELREKK
jgi:DnaJ-class molecular chaperone